VRIVLDTNAVVSGLLWHNTPYRLLERAVEDEATELFSSPALLAELTEVLERAHLAAKLAEHQTSVEALVALYGTFVQLVSPEAISRVAPDPDDDEAIARYLPSRDIRTSRSSRRHKHCGASRREKMGAPIMGSWGNSI
jgi:putative PIN family toxin of toxin-antitoxin system